MQAMASHLKLVLTVLTTAKVLDGDETPELVMLVSCASESATMKQPFENTPKLLEDVFIVIVAVFALVLPPTNV